MDRGDDILRGIYGVGALVVGGLAFLGSWVYAVSAYGWFLGGGLGWFPAIFIGMIVGALWPLPVLGLLYLYAQGNF